MKHGKVIPLILALSGLLLAPLALASDDSGRGLGRGERPVWSPDGKTLGFTKGDKVVLHNLATKKESVIAREDVSLSLIAFSPDGGRLGISSKHGFIVTDLKGKELAEVKGAPESPYYGPVWSPDGSKLAFGNLVGEDLVLYTTDATKRDLAQWAQPAGQPRLGGRLMPEEAALWPAFSPDGRKIAFMVTEHSGESALWVTNLAEQDTLNLLYKVDKDKKTQVGISNEGFSWSKDSKWVVAGTLGAEANGVVKVSVDGQKVVKLTALDFNFSPAFSPLGDRIAYVHSAPKGTGWAYSIWVIGPDGGKGRAVSAEFDAPVARLTWSPDGKSLAFELQKDRYEPEIRVLAVE